MRADAALGRPELGTWQGIHVWVHRLRPPRRGIALHLLGEPADAADGIRWCRLGNAGTALAGPDHELKEHPMNETRPDPRIPSESGAAEATSAVGPSASNRTTVPAQPTVPEQPARALHPTPSVGASDGARADAEAQADADAQTRRRTEGTPPPADQVLEHAAPHAFGATLGAIGGAGVGAVIGIAAGPVGSLIGAVGGAVAGGLLGSGAAGETPVAGPVSGAAEDPESSPGLTAAAAAAVNFGTSESPATTSGGIPPRELTQPRKPSH